jgi:hypothetical protein
MFLKLFFDAALTRHCDFLLEIPLAHCVRGGMVCAAGREKGKKKGGGRKEFRNPKTYRRRPFFSPLGSVRDAPFRRRR